MIDAAASKEHGVKWSHVLDYMEAHCVQDYSKDDVKLPFESPFPTFYVPGDILQRELRPDTTTGDSLLRSVLYKIPVNVCAALCHLGPDALTAIDSHGRNPLHYACRYPPSTTTTTTTPRQLDQVMTLLITANPITLLQRDTAGRTPLHYLFWYHASTRTPELVQAFLCKLPKTEFYSLKQNHQSFNNKTVGDTATTAASSSSPKQTTAAAAILLQKKYPLPEIPLPNNKGHVPSNAAIVHDGQHGCLPLHYAIMNGASLPAVFALMHAYPLSKHVCDRYGRTPLHWYLGAGSLEANRRLVSGEVAETTTTTTTTTAAAAAAAAEPWWDHVLNKELIKHLLSSRVARTADRTGRYPLHWACSFLAHNYWYSDTPGKAMTLDIIQLLLDHYVGQIVCCDEKNMTPLHVLFDTIVQLQDRDWEYKGSSSERRKSHNVVRGGSPTFSPPQKLLEMLLKHPDVTSDINVAAIEDVYGRLPLHVAMEVAPTPEAVEILLEIHPTGLVHTTENGMVPLHSAFGRKHTAPLQSARVINLLMQSYEAGKHGTVIDGRLGLKMEDSSGKYPMHYACENLACLEVIDAIVERYPQTAMLQGPNGDLPVHCLLTDELILAAASLNVTKTTPKAKNNSKQQGVTLEERLSVATSKMSVLLRPLVSDQTKLAVADSKCGMLPLHIAVLFEAAPYKLLLRMLELCPESAMQHTTHPAYTFSALDFHDLRRAKWTRTSAEWTYVRDLLYSFGPSLESHRHRQELLKRCVRLIINELNGSDTYHLDLGNEKDECPPDLEITHTVSNMEDHVLRYCKRKRFGEIARPREASHSRTRRSTARTENATSIETSTLAESEIAPGVLKSSSTLTGSQTTPGLPSNPLTTTESNINRGLLTNSSSIYDEEDTAFRYDGSTSFVEDTFSSSSSMSGSSGPEYLSSDEDDDDLSGDDEGSESADGPFPTFSGSTGASFPTGSTSYNATTRNGDSTFSTRSSLRTIDVENRHGGWGAFSASSASRSYSLSPRGTILSAKNTELEQEDAFEAAKRKVEDEFQKNGSKQSAEVRGGKEEEKKEEVECDAKKESKRASKSTGKKDSKAPTALQYERPSYISEVAFRIWTFFVLYCDPNNPGDNYVEQVDDILEEIEFSLAQALVHTPLPPFAQQYLGPNEKLDGLTFKLRGSPKCREVIYKTCYFLGKYQFDEENDVLIHRSQDNSTILIRAYEWMFSTEEETDAVQPGVSEEKIWSSGEVPAQLGTTFQAWKRPVWFKFMKNSSEYHNEVNSRQMLGVSLGGLSQTDREILPLLGHFNAFGTERKEDRTYKVDTSDERFSSIRLYRRKSNMQDGNKIILKEYPFAVVYPVSARGTLYHYYLEKGSPAPEEARELIQKLGSGLKNLHEAGLIHGSLTLRRCFMSVNKEGNDGDWTLGDLSLSSQKNDVTSFLGSVSSEGYPEFNTETLPPEMFSKLSPIELNMYRTYWKAVEEIYKVKINEAAIEPKIDPKSGEVYVVKCHYVPPSASHANTRTLPSLPYELVRANTRADTWAFGILMFTIISGRPLFGTDTRTGSLLDYKCVCEWTPEVAELIVNEHIGDPVAQDIILRILTTKDQIQESLHSLLCRPYFSLTTSSATALEGVINSRRTKIDESKNHLRRLVHDEFQDSWWKERSVSIDTWDFDLLERIHFSPTEITRGMTPNKRTYVPSSFLVLPYRLPRDDFLPAPLSAEVQARTENIGKGLLELSKACTYVNSIKEKLSDDANSNRSTYSWDMFESMDIGKRVFKDIHAKLNGLASIHVELFRQNPLAVALKLLEEEVKAFLSTLEKSPVFMYPFDEYRCVPVARDRYPVEVPVEVREQVTQNCFLSMYLCSLYARGTSQDVSGLLKMLVGSAKTNVPLSWRRCGLGLSHKLDDSLFANDIRLLEQVLSDMFATRHKIGEDDERLVDFLDKADPKRELADMRRVSATGASFWTTSEGAARLQTSSQSISFKEALQRHRGVRS